MKINKNVEINLKLDVHHYYETMSTEDKIKLSDFNNPTDLKIEHHTWNDLWEIYYKKTPVGYIDLYKDTKNRVITVMGVYILESFRNKHIIQDIASPLANYYFNDLGFNKVEASAFEFNESSLKLCNKFAVREGCKRENMYYKNRFWNKIMFGLTKVDFDNWMYKKNI